MQNRGATGRALVPRARLRARHRESIVAGMDLSKEDDGIRGSFVLTEEGHRVGVLTYEHGHGRVITADHTWVDDAHRGRGIAGKLVEALVAWAQAERMTVVPSCSYVARWFDAHPEQAALLAS